MCVKLYNIFYFRSTLNQDYNMWANGHWNMLRHGGFALFVLHAISILD